MRFHYFSVFFLCISIKIATFATKFIKGGLSKFSKNKFCYPTVINLLESGDIWPHQRYMQSLSQLFYQYAGVQPDKVEQLTASGSNRRYYRLTAPDVSLIGVQGTSCEENGAFLYMADHFLSKGLNPTMV